MKTVANLVLYVVADSGVQPLFSLAPDDVFAQAKIVARVGSEMEAATRRGVPCPDFAVVHEERTANESGIVLSAKFTEHHPVTGEQLRSAGSRDDLFSQRAQARAKATEVAPVSQEEKLSLSLSQ